MWRRLAFVAIVAIIIGAAGPAFAAGPTFAKDVAPILYKNCVECHRPGEVAPMSLLSYEQARPWAKAIKRKVVAREMPPWFADPASSVKFVNDRRLSQKDIDTLSAWADAGAPKGADTDMPAPPQFATGWLHPKGIPPDYVIEMPFEFEVPADGELPMMNFYTKIPFTEDKFVEAVQARPGNREVVHHIALSMKHPPKGTRVENGVLVNEQTGVPIPQDQQRGGGDVGDDDDRAEAQRETQQSQQLAIYAPGWVIENYRPGVGERIPGDGRYIDFNMHYQMTGKPEKDRSSVGLWFQKVPMTHELKQKSISDTHIIEGKELVTDQAALKTARQRSDVSRATPQRALLPPIPAYAENWGIVGVSAFTDDVTVHSLTPHMHLRGKDMKYVAVYPDGREETVLNVPKYDFNWQVVYVPETPLKLPAGSKLVVYGHFDNSPRNKYNPAPNKEVYWSEQSWDEMFFGFIKYTVDKNDLTKQPKATQEQQQ
jgi:hypothetical protein